MTERRDGPRGDDEMESHPKDSWVEAAAKGTLLLPQNNMGACLFMAEALVSDPPDDWEHAVDTQLTTEQITKLQRTVAAAHRRKQIETPKAKTGLEPETLQILWKSFINWTMFGLRDYARLCEPAKTWAPGRNPGESARIFFQNPDRAEHVQRLLSLLRFVKKELQHNPEIHKLIQECADNYNDLFAGLNSAEERKLKLEEVKAKNRVIIYNLRDRLADKAVVEIPELQLRQGEIRNLLAAFGT